ncbi:glycosyltransferase family 2 protein [Flavobacterium sp. RHBU_3]|uniref:glycosyltransferase family 2 protein n=1 Tax=Flavobacterium sp. RHBU_3 TaxID=3391184 RepID=UPI003984D255
MRLSVIILNYNVRHFLHLCLQSVQHATRHLDAEIIVVDNNSPDDSCAMVKQYFPDVVLIENPENSGFPKGNNIGVAVAKGDYVCILNPDTVVAEDTFDKLFQFVNDTPNAGITGVKLVDGRGNFLPESKRGLPTPWVAFTKISGLYKMFPGVQSFNKYYNKAVTTNGIGTTDILVGAFMFMERNLYLEVGGFDEDCFMYSDDFDLSYTVTKKGLGNYYFGKATAIHFKGESTVKDGTYMRRFREAMQFFYKKHFRSYPVFDLFMRMGAFAFMFVKKNRTGKVVVPQSYILVSKDALLGEGLKQVLQKPLLTVPDLQTESVFLQHTGAEVIFDAATVSYGQVIAFMEKHGGAFTYKMKPEGAGFIIGSNSSDDRGTVRSV